MIGRGGDLAVGSLREVRIRGALLRLLLLVLLGVLLLRARLGEGVSDVTLDFVREREEGGREGEDLRMNSSACASFTACSSLSALTSSLISLLLFCSKQRSKKKDQSVASRKRERGAGR